MKDATLSGEYKFVDMESVLVNLKCEVAYIWFVELIIEALEYVVMMGDSLTTRYPSHDDSSKVVGFVDSLEICR